MQMLWSYFTYPFRTSETEISHEFLGKTNARREPAQSAIVMQTQEEFKNAMSNLQLDSTPFTIDWANRSVILIYKAKGNESSALLLKNVKKVAEDVLKINLNLVEGNIQFSGVGGEWILIGVAKMLKIQPGKVTIEVSRQKEPDQTEYSKISNLIDEMHKNGDLQSVRENFDYLGISIADESHLESKMEDIERSEWYQQLKNKKICQEYMKKTLLTSCQQKLWNSQYKQECQDLMTTYAGIAPLKHVS
jgi:hypothetical protein